MGVNHIPPHKNPRFVGTKNLDDVDRKFANTQANNKSWHCYGHSSKSSDRERPHLSDAQDLDQ